jgi:site-specific recombinase XerC
MLLVLKTAAWEPFSRVDPKAIIAGRDRRAATPSQAKNFLSTMRGLFVWAVDSNLVAADPTQGIKNKKSKHAKSGGFPVWTDDEIFAFERRWPRGTRERVMFEVFLYTGLRRGDAAVVGWQHVRNGVISLQTEKAGRFTFRYCPNLKQHLKPGRAVISPSSPPPATETPWPKRVWGTCLLTHIERLE